MVYEFIYGGHVYDIKTADELPSAVAIRKHAEEVKEKNNLPYVTVQERRL